MGMTADAQDSSDSSPPPPSALIVLMDGFEEMEAVAPIDLLRRAGVQVTVASREEFLTVTGRNNITVTAEVFLASVAQPCLDALILPGGPGVSRLRNDPIVLDLVRRYDAAGRLVAAICAAPTVLQTAGILRGRACTGHSSVLRELPNAQAGSPVVEDGNLVTSRGPGTATAFALALVARLTNPAQAAKIAAAIHFAG